MALVGQPWFEPPIEPLAAVMRRQLDSYPFRQLPRYVEEGDVDLVQSMVGRTCTWAGCGCGGGLCRRGADRTRADAAGSHMLKQLHTASCLPLWLLACAATGHLKALGAQAQ